MREETDRLDEPEVTLTDTQVELCFPYLRYRLPGSDRQILSYTKERSERYLKALYKEIAARSRQYPEALIWAVTLRSGAALEEPAVLRRLLRKVHREFPLVHPEADITLEANLGEWDVSRMSDYIRAGINRFHVRAYALSRRSSERLGCLYVPEQLELLLKEKNRHPEAMVSVELLYGLPWETDFDFKRRMEQLLRMNLSQISFVPYRGVESAQTREREELQRKAILFYLVSYGYKMYAEMAFAREESESLEVVLRDRGMAQIGFGLGARTRYGNKEFKNRMDFERYLEKPRDCREATAEETEQIARMCDKTLQEFSKVLEQMVSR